jgi:ABC-type transport system involved in multi-copper enzyme maturation permease subunit
LAGPVFFWELVRSSRRRWHWWARGLFVALLFILLQAEFRDATSRSSTRAMASAASSFYQSLSVCQLLSVIILSPIYAAASMAEEKTQRTLPFLLSSQLSDREIVLGKHWLACLRVWEVLFAGLPFAAVCLWLGGIPPEILFADFLVAAAAAWATCAMAVLAAVWVRRLVDVLLLLFALQTAWYCLPLIQFFFGTFGVIVLHIPEFVLQMNAFRAIRSGQSPGTIVWWDFYGIPIVGMTVWGAACCMLAQHSLRLAWHRSQASAGSAMASARRFQWLARRTARRPVSSNPVLWRELCCRRPSRVDRIAWILGCLLTTGVLGWLVLDWQNVSASSRAGGLAGMPPAAFMAAILSVFFYMGVVTLPYLAATGATAFSEERETNQLELLLGSDLDHAEIVRAKAVRLFSLLIVMMLFPVLVTAALRGMWYVSVSTFLLMAFQCFAAGAFAVSLGLTIGIVCAKTSQAVVTTLSILLALWLGLPLIGALAGSDEFMALWSPPVHWLLMVETDNRISSTDPRQMQLRGMSALVSVVYAIASVALYVCSLPKLDPWQRLERIVWSGCGACTLLAVALLTLESVYRPRRYDLPNLWIATLVVVVQLGMISVPYAAVAGMAALASVRESLPFARRPLAEHDWSNLLAATRRALALRLAIVLGCLATFGATLALIRGASVVGLLVALVTGASFLTFVMTLGLFLVIRSRRAIRATVVFSTVGLALGSLGLFAVSSGAVTGQYPGTWLAFAGPSAQSVFLLVWESEEFRTPSFGPLSPDLRSIALYCSVCYLSGSAVLYWRISHRAILASLVGNTANLA